MYLPSFTELNSHLPPVLNIPLNHSMCHFNPFSYVLLLFCLLLLLLLLPTMSKTLKIQQVVRQHREQRDHAIRLCMAI